MSHLYGLLSQLVLTVCQAQSSDGIGDEAHGRKVGPVGDSDGCRVGMGAVRDDAVEDLMSNAKLAGCQQAQQTRVTSTCSSTVQYLSSVTQIGMQGLTGGGMMSLH